MGDSFALMRLGLFDFLNRCKGLLPRSAPTPSNPNRLYGRCLVPREWGPAVH